MNAQASGAGVLSGSRYVTGGVLASVTAGVEATFTICARDKNGNRLGTGNATQAGNIQVLVYDAALATRAVKGSVEYSGADGLYVAKFTPEGSGSNLVHVMLGGAHIASSPYTVSVAQGSAVGATTVATGSGLSTATSSVESTFVVDVRDVHSNTRAAFTDTSAIAMSLVLASPGTGTSASVTAASVTPLTGADAGRYTVAYVPRFAGSSLLSVTISGAHIKGSPFTVIISDGAAAGATSTAAGSAVGNATAGSEATFVIQAKDAEGNNKAGGGDVYTVAITGDTALTGSCVYRTGSAGREFVTVALEREGEGGREGGGGGGGGGGEGGGRGEGEREREREREIHHKIHSTTQST